MTSPSLETLRMDLERAEHDLVCADMIDSNVRRDAEKSSARQRIASIKQQIVRLEETY
ncbi:hypothetical protein [Mesorhizobium sp. ANAO-SY3R2]|uniref:hypothetical protein n=1 Tax=Mesorhizobium sp. ANAO-SY3R2 TaxID=3166644 RepID=UPI0036700C0D